MTCTSFASSAQPTFDAVASPFREVSCKVTTEVQESLSSLQEEKAVIIDELTQRTEERCVEIRTPIDKLESTSIEIKKQGRFVGKDAEVEMILTSGTLNSAEAKKKEGN